MANTPAPRRLSPEIRAQARRFEAEVTAGAVRRRRWMIAVLCGAVVLAGGAGGALLARSGVYPSTAVAEGNGVLRPGDVQFAQVLDPDQTASDANPAGE